MEITSINKAQLVKDKIKGFSYEDHVVHYKKEIERYEEEHTNFIKHYRADKCYLCKNPLDTISETVPCLHWLLRKCEFKKKHFKKIIKKYDYYDIHAYLRWVANAEVIGKNINNLKEESNNNKKMFEVTIKWKNIEWTLDCSKNDFNGHEGRDTNFPHWHFQMRIDERQFINFSDFHIHFSDEDQLKIILENDPDSGFRHTFGPGGQGMQEYMDYLVDNPNEFIANTISSQNPNEGMIRMQSIIKGSISGDKIKEANEMVRTTGKSMDGCLKIVLSDNKNTSITTIVSPSDNVPEIAKRTERKKR